MATLTSDVGNKLLGWVMVGAGSLLAYSAVKNRKPWDVIRNIGPTDEDNQTPTNPPATPVDTTPTGNLPAIMIRVAKIQRREIPPVLVPIRPQGQLDKDAAASLARAQKAAGFEFNNVGNYRTYADQARYYASDPDRYAPPDKSAHVVGLALDIIDSAITRAKPHMMFEGWQFTVPDEPWHCSYLVRA